MKLLRVGVLAPTASLLGLVGAGCGWDPLDVSDPTAIEDQELANAAGAELLRSDALRLLKLAVADGAFRSGLLSDEFFADTHPNFALLGIVNNEEMLDRRESERYEQISFTWSFYDAWPEVRRAATVAIPKLRAFAPPERANAHVGEMFATRGFATMRLAEDYCPGFPLHEIVDLKPIYGGPLSTAEAFERALADFDSALVHAADSARVLNFARLGRARTLLGLGRFSDAAATVTQVPTDFNRGAEYTGTQGSTLENPLGLFGVFVDAGVSDREGDTGLDFTSANDPRVQVTFANMAFDGVTTLYRAGKYPDESAPIVVASGVEARLIEAEAALNVGDQSWLTILNDLRAISVMPPLPPLSDPGTSDARVDLLFRERAFWLFGTGHRLSDVRRLVTHYGRAAETVFPKGTYRLGGGYGTATSIPFPADKEEPFNAAVTGCTSR